MRRWLAVAWFVLIAQGAATTGALRIALAGPVNAARWAFYLHWIAGAGLVVLTIAALARSDSPRRWIPTLLVSATAVFGWLASRGFDPRLAAAHAAIAAISIVAFIEMGMQVFSRAAVLLVAVQVAIGAAVRHQLIGIEWHLLFAGLAGLAVLVPAVKVVNSRVLAPDGPRAARWAIAAVISQVLLGAAIFVMMMIGPPSAIAWLTVTVAHVTVGTLTLAATALFASTVASRAGDSTRAVSGTPR